MKEINDIRKKVINLTKIELSRMPFVDGKRQTRIGFMSSMFEEATEAEKERSLTQLADDFNSEDLYLAVGEDANTLWAIEYEILKR